jgi:hypothetical protein
VDPVKIIIFVAAFLLLLLLGRKLSGGGEVHAYHPSDAIPPQAGQVSSKIQDALDFTRAPAAVGSELPFPVPLPELTTDDDGRFNRPEFTNYYFAESDLVQGPPDPQSFADELFIETRDPEDDRSVTYKYIVATPSGLQRSMEAERLPALCLQDQMVLVPRWDLKVILATAVQDILKTYGDYASVRSGDRALPEDDANRPS